MDRIKSQDPHAKNARETDGYHTAEVVVFSSPILNNASMLNLSPAINEDCSKLNKCIVVGVSYFAVSKAVSALHSF